ncbi:MAG: hypothetical protein ACM3YE_17200 [Bacteroidota bacterium]
MNQATKDPENTQKATPDLDAQIKEWKAKYGDIYDLSIDDPEECPELADKRIICRQPGRTHMSRFVKEIASGGDALKAQNNFFYDCLLYPDAEVIKQATDKKPGLIIALGNTLQKQTGINQVFTVKKL